MPIYGIPGVSTTKRRSQVTGVLALAVVAVVAISWIVIDNARGDNRMEIVLRTDRIGDGIAPGTQVRLDGVNVGSIAAIDSGEAGRQLITLKLNQSQLFGVTDNLAIDYAPANLFGISEVELKRRDGGSPLQENAIIDLSDDPARAQDATMGALIRSLSQTSTEVLTPQLAENLTRVAANLGWFTPLIEAMIATGQNLADTQKYPVSFLLGQYGSTLTGAAELIDGTVKLLDRFKNIEVLRTQRDLFDTGVNTIAKDFFPAVANTLFTAQRYLTGYADMLTPILNITSQMVPSPQLSGSQLREILDRLDNSFTETPDGPILNLALTLRGVPALSVPLLGTSSAPLAGGAR
ncbi:MCE family protein [Antrihabitans sp. YC3-6]|uniref:MCE family protein n=1 Tax=Antrihabitans stalagmiti TaxID=2799499 RepID=A0A934TZX8_9NOCA|nr:MlaD family protein [Antrihabitans stalagmiti]MBJ8337260.1 MCE family protein [Antrihabitans stalagmiti]